MLIKLGIRWLGIGDKGLGICIYHLTPKPQSHSLNKGDREL